MTRPLIATCGLLAALSSPASAATTTRFVQAEGATFNGACTKDTNQAGFTGTSFVNCPNDTTSFITWNGVKVQAAGTKRLKFRYANGGTVGRTAEVMVNGVVVNGALAFPVTGAWTTWTFATLDVALNAGDNTVRLRGIVGGQGLANIDRLDVAEISETTPDWGIAVSESTMLRSPTHLKTDGTGAFNGWGYAYALRLHGIYLTYLRTGDTRYRDYVKAWVDAVIGPTGNIYTSNTQTTVRSLNALDHILPGALLLDVYNQFPQGNYQTALKTIRNRFSNADNSDNTTGAQPNWSGVYNRTTDGGLWHSTGKDAQLWLDGAFMAQKFLSAYGMKFGGADKTYADDQAALHIKVQHNHLKDPTTGLLWHAYDESLPIDFPVAPGTQHSQEFWCRAMGWYGMITAEVLDLMPTNHPDRPQLISILNGLVTAWTSYQDPASGRWFQIVNKGSNPANWTETSCSAMYSYTTSRAIQSGYVNASAAPNLSNGYWGVLQKISFGADSGLAADLTNILDISEGTNLGDEAYYFARMRPVNDDHGIGAFLIMYEHFVPAPPPPPPVPSAPSGLVAADGVGQSVLTWSDNSADEAGFMIERKVQGAADSTYAQVGQIGPNATGTATFTNVVGAGSYTYRVRAFQGPARSAYSNSDDAVVTTAGGTITLNPVADAHVRDGSSAGTNFGTAPALEQKNSTVAGNNRRTFLRFSLTSITSVSNAKLRLFGNSVTTAKLVGVYAISDTGWGETTITWNNAPQIGAKQGSSQTVGLTAAWTEWDLTGYVQAQKAGGASAVTFEVKQDMANNETPSTFNSREGTNKPVLLITP